MAETVSTGGSKSFHYDKDYNPKLSKDEKQDIRNAYSDARERRRKEKRNRNITIVVVILIVLIILGAVFLR